MSLGPLELLIQSWVSMRVERGAAARRLLPNCGFVN